MIHKSYKISVKNNVASPLRKVDGRPYSNLREKIQFLKENLYGLTDSKNNLNAYGASFSPSENSMSFGLSPQSRKK